MSLRAPMVRNVARCGPSPCARECRRTARCASRRRPKRPAIRRGARDRPIGPRERNIRHVHVMDLQQAACSTAPPAAHAWQQRLPPVNAQSPARFRRTSSGVQFGRISPWCPCTELRIIRCPNSWAVTRPSSTATSCSCRLRHPLDLAEVHRRQHAACIGNDRGPYQAWPDVPRPRGSRRSRSGALRVVLEAKKRTLRTDSGRAISPAHVHERRPQQGLGFGQGALLERGRNAGGLIDPNRDGGPKNRLGRECVGRFPGGAREDESEAISRSTTNESAVRTHCCWSAPRRYCPIGHNAARTRSAQAERATARPVRRLLGGYSANWGRHDAPASRAKLHRRGRRRSNRL